MHGFQKRLKGKDWKFEAKFFRESFYNERAQ